MIKPTVGRKVWYVASDNDLKGPMPMSVAGSREAGTLQPLDATILAVWGDRMVNALVLDACGKAFPKLSVTLVQEGDTAPECGGYIMWMPYQQGQAKKEGA